MKRNGQLKKISAKSKIFDKLLSYFAAAKSTYFIHHNVIIMKYFVSLCLILFFSSSIAYTQHTKYWIFFKEKDTHSYDYRKVLSEQTIANRTLLKLPLYQYSDIPVNTNHIAILEKDGVTIQNISKWLNAVTAYLSNEQLQKIKQYSFVSHLRPVRYTLQAATVVQKPKVQYDAKTPPFRSVSYPNIQVEGKVFRDKNLTGKVRIGVLDGAFHGVRFNKYTTDLIANGQIRAYRDFVNPMNSNFFGDNPKRGITHGASVLMRIGGRKRKKHIGLAPDAEYYLARTEDSASEYRAEEDNWICGIEWLEGFGVRLVNTSLGYSDSFDKEEDKYKPEQMDGATALITQAASIAAKQKGMLLVISAGNEGHGSWRVISAPADAPEVLSIGAVTGAGFKMGYSSIGRKEVDYIKPNVSCYSMRGTSFSAPVITGFMACLMEYQPSLDYRQLIDVVQQAAHLYPFGNNHVGYGVPTASRALAIMDKTYKNNNEKIISKKTKQTIRLAEVGEDIRAGLFRFAGLFHKKDRKEVKDVAFIKLSKKMVIERPAGIRYTTVVLPNKVYEIEWVVQKDTNP